MGYICDQVDLHAFPFHLVLEGFVQAASDVAQLFRRVIIQGFLRYVCIGFQISFRDPFNLPDQFSEIPLLSRNLIKMFSQIFHAKYTDTERDYCQKRRPADHKQPCKENCKHEVFSFSVDRKPFHSQTVCKLQSFFFGHPSLPVPAVPPPGRTHTKCVF